MGAGGPFQDKPALRVESLTLVRGGRTLFADLSFAAAGGAFVEIRGANGSGKTSLLRAIAGFLRPRGGRIAFDALDEPSTALHYVGHLNGLKGAASVRAHVRYWMGLFGGAAASDADALERLSLTRIADAPARALSQGQARRLALARLLVAPRPIWLLDEPAAALDASGKTLLADLISKHRADGGMVIAAVHEPLGPEPAQVVTLA
jgi:heme exporter protein A